MLENPLLKTNYIGRDGYVWWIGQIAKEEHWIANIAERPVDSPEDFKGFDHRYKVRILGYHPADKKELSDDDLPWASVLFPVTGGSGQGGASQSPNLRQGMFVNGFFLDGEDGQQPVITGVFGMNQYAAISRNSSEDLDWNNNYTSFSAFKTGADANFVPQFGLPTKQVEALANSGAFNPNNKVVTESIIGYEQYYTGADRQAELDSLVQEVLNPSVDCDLERSKTIQTIMKKGLNRKQRLEKAKKNWIDRVSTRVGNLKTRIDDTLDELDDIDADSIFDAAIDRTMTDMTEGITEQVKTVTDNIQRNVTKNINKTMAKAYSKVFPSRLVDLKKVQDKANDDLSCAFRNISANLFKMVGKFLNQSINKLINGPICLINNFVGSLLGKISGVIDGAVDSILGPIKSLLSSIGGAADLVGELTDVASSALSFLSCGQTPSCSEVESWSPDGGAEVSIPELSPSIAATLDIPGTIFKAKEVYSGIKKSIGKFKNIGDSVNSVVESADFGDVFDDAKGSCNVGPLRCGPPTIEFFGGGGSGAAGNAIIGAAGTLLGVDVILPGSGYTDVPFISFKDSCGKGGGASGTAVINDGQVVEVIMNETGTGYLPAPDGSQGGDGATWADADETTVKRADGTYEVPYKPQEVITVCPGDEVTEPGGKVILIEGTECTQITAKSPDEVVAEQVERTAVNRTSPTSNTGEYPVVLTIDSINVVDGGFNYDCSKDTVVVEPNNGAKLSIGRCDSLGGIITINVDDGGSGFTDDPKIYIQSDTGYNIKLVPTFKIIRVDQDPDAPVVSPADTIQVIDCVGKF